MHFEPSPTTLAAIFLPQGSLLKYRKCPYPRIACALPNVLLFTSGCLGPALAWATVRRCEYGTHADERLSAGILQRPSCLDHHAYVLADAHLFTKLCWWSLVSRLT